MNTMTKTQQAELIGRIIQAQAQMGLVLEERTLMHALADVIGPRAYKPMLEAYYAAKNRPMVCSG